MADIATASERLKEPDQRRWTIAHYAAQPRTIRGRILVAFLAMSLITGAVGGYAALGMKQKKPSAPASQASPGRHGPSGPSS